MTMSPRHGDAVNETTPLISSEAVQEESQIENGHADDQNLDSSDSDKLPLFQIALLCFARFTEPIAFFSIFPFISQMIQDAAGAPEADVGFYSGLIESILSFTQMLLMIPWGRAADRFGRKPVLVGSLAGLSCSIALFGTARTIWQMIVYRSLAGVFSGTIVAVRASISENSTPKTQAQAFSYFAFASNMGIFLGPLLGGALSRPADQYPSLFGSVKLFKVYPYALPTFTTGSIAAIACITCALFLKETLKTASGDGSDASRPKITSTSEIIKSPGVARVLFLQVYTMLLALAYTAIMPVFYFTSAKLGGYGLSEFQISIFIGIGGLSQAIYLLFVFPPLQRRIGTGGVLRLCVSVWPIWFFLTAAINLLRRFELDALFWALGPIVLVVGSGIAMAFTACQLAVNDISPSPETLGTVNAISLTLNSAIRAVAPALFSISFAAGVKKQIFNGYLAWVILIILAIGLRISLRWLPEKAEGKVFKSAASPELEDEEDQ